MASNDDNDDDDSSTRFNIFTSSSSNSTSSTICTGILPRRKGTCIVLLCLAMPLVFNLRFFWGAPLKEYNLNVVVSMTDEVSSILQFKEEEESNNSTMNQTLSSVLSLAPTIVARTESNATRASHKSTSTLDEAARIRMQQRLEAADPIVWERLPSWAREYFAWHTVMREQYPDTALFQQDNNGPNVLVKICIKHCGGSFDRLGKIHGTLALAAQTNRVILFKWCNPMDLEHFLVPNLINWTAPIGVLPDCDYLKEHFSSIRPFGSTKPKKTTLLPWAKGVQERVVMRTKQNVQTSAFPKDMRLDENGMYGIMFGALFRPSVGVQARIDKVYRDLDIASGNYSAAHLRVRHPGFAGSTSQTERGYQFEGKTKEMSTKAALKAVLCTAKLLRTPEEPIYFMSDSSELVEYIAYDDNKSGEKGNATAHNQTELDSKVSTIKQMYRLISRNVTEFPTLHIDNCCAGDSPEEYMDTFVDLYLAANARCVSFGVGNFAYMATMISGTTCLNKHSQTDRGKIWNQHQHVKGFCSLTENEKTLLGNV